MHTLEIPTINFVIPFKVKATKRQRETGKPFFVNMLVTPEVALEWLKNNRANRPLSESTVDNYAHYMKKGKWVYNGDTFKFDIRGNLRDGQHRLNAVIKSGVSLESTLVIGLNEDTFLTMDIGKKRSASDILAIEGYTYTNVLASVCKFIIHWAWGEKKAAAERGRGGDYVSHEDILKFAFENERAAESVKFSFDLYKGSTKVMSHKLVAALHYLFGEKDRALANRFLTSLQRGSNMENHSVTHQVFLRLNESKNSKYHKLTETYKVAMIVKAWNELRNGRKYTKILTSGRMSIPDIE